MLERLRSWFLSLSHKDDVAALPVGTSGTLLALASTSTFLGIVLLVEGESLVDYPGFRPMEVIGMGPLALIFFAIGVGLGLAWKTGYGVVFWLRTHSFYWGFWAAMFAFAWYYYDAPATAVPVYLGLASWSMLAVATVKQWRRLQQGQ